MITLENRVQKFNVLRSHVVVGHVTKWLDEPWEAYLDTEPTTFLGYFQTREEAVNTVTNELR